MRIVNNKLIPELIYSNPSNKAAIEDCLYKFEELEPIDRRQVFDTSQHVSILKNRPYLIQKLESTYTIMKLRGGYSGDEFKSMVAWAKAKGEVVQWDMQRLNGGGQGGTSPGKIDIGKEQYAEKMLRKLGIWKAYNELSLSKRMDRIHKMFGVIQDFKVKPVIKIGKDTPPELEGLIFATQEWMDANGLPYAAKSTFVTKGLIIPANLKDCDVLIPANENKWKLSEKKLSQLMKWRPDMSPEFAFSKNLKRHPTAKIDLLSLLNYVPGLDFDVDIQRQIDIYNGEQPTMEELYLMFGYTNSEGDKVLRDEGIRVLLGENMHSLPKMSGPKALGRWAMSKLEPKMKGYYGIVMPMTLFPKSGKIRKMWYTRWPWNMPILTKVGTSKNCIFIDEELQLLFGGDFDRDQGACFFEDQFDNGYEWPRDQKVLKELFRQPEKEDGEFPDEWTEYDVIAYQLDQYSGCGIAYNNGKIALDVARKVGHSVDEIRDMDIKLTSEKVQPFIDGFKYAGAGVDIEAPTPTVMLDWLNVKHSKEDIDIVTDLFRLCRSRGKALDFMAVISRVCREESKSFYERFLLNFKEFEKPELSDKPVPEEVDDLVRSTYVEFMDSDDVQFLRYQKLKTADDRPDFIYDVLRSCWARNDIGLARYIMNELRNEYKILKEVDNTTA